MERVIGVPEMVATLSESAGGWGLTGDLRLMCEVDSFGKLGPLSCGVSASYG